MFAWNDIIAISSLGGASGYFWLRILKGRPRLYSHVQLTLFVYLERFRRYSTFLYLAGISLLGGEILRVFWAKWPPKRQVREKHLLGGHSLAPNCVFWAIVREIICIRLACAGAQEKKAVRKAGRSPKKCIFHVCVERPLAGGFQPNLAHVFVSRTLSNVQSFIVMTWEVSELWGVEVSMLP